MLIFPRRLEVTAILSSPLSPSTSGCSDNISVWSPYTLFSPIPFSLREWGHTLVTWMQNGFFIPSAQAHPCWLQAQVLLCEATAVGNTGAVLWLYKGVSAKRVPGSCLPAVYTKVWLGQRWEVAGACWDWMAAGFHLCDMSLYRLGFYEGTPAVHDTGVT